jgi:PEP-CTERM motif
MKKIQFVALLGLATLLLCVRPAMADAISSDIGTQHFTSGNSVTTGAFLTAVAGQPAPFNAFCGSDITSNCSTSWTFNYTVPVGDTITGATLTLGILDIDSAAAGSQIASFSLNGGDSLTTFLSAAAEGLNGGAGAPNSQYDVLTITIPAAFLVDLSGGTATFALALQGPGLGILGPTTFNGAGLDFSDLNITATPGTTVPEPATLMLLGFGLLALTATSLRK